MMKRLAVLLAFVAGCTMIDQHKAPPADWPVLERRVVKLSFMELQKVCGGSIFAQTFACADINFDLMSCTKYYFSDDEYGLLGLEHEEDHCQGKDHIGSDQLLAWWTNWKAQRSPGPAPRAYGTK